MDIPREIPLPPLPDLRLRLTTEPPSQRERFKLSVSVDRDLLEHCRTNRHAAAMLWNRLTHELEAEFVRFLTTPPRGLAEDDEDERRRTIADSQGH